MLQLERNSLVWPTPEGWATLHVQASPDPVAQAVVQHWHAQGLPLMVGRQAGVPSQNGVTLGLPAPTQWDRRRQAFALPVSQLAYSGRFPRLSDATLRQRWRRRAQALDFALGELLGHAVGAVQVYGSFGWQCLTGLRYLRDESDLDLRLAVPDLAAAEAVVRLLADQSLPCRIDGELVFPGGQAIAWREMAQLLEGRVTQVLAKRIDGIALIGLDGLLLSAATLPA